MFGSVGCWFADLTGAEPVAKGLEDFWIVLWEFEVSTRGPDEGAFKR